MGSNHFFKWITIPPVVAIATIMVARAMGTGNVSGEIDLAVWGLVWLLFIVLSVLYGLFIANGFTAGLLPLQALSQGILLCPLSIMYGARMFQWLGVLLAVCGGAVLVVLYNQLEAEKNKVVVLEVENDMKQLPVNFAITDETGAVLSLTDSMLEVLGLSRVDMIGKNISEWFSPVSKTAEIGGKIWDIKRVSINDGRRFYFELNPKGLPMKEEPAEGEKLTGDALLFMDEDTQLHNFRYGYARISDELYRAGRYSRAVSAVMIRVVFPQLLPTDDMEKYSRPFRAYTARVMQNIRQTDTAIQTGEFQIMLVLSECPYQMVENVIQRLSAITNALVPTFEEFLNATVLSVYETFEGGNNVPSAQELIDRMTQSMTRKYSANALSE